jgi:alpha,alpha-trehalase
LADKRRAKTMVRTLSRFKAKGGLTTTDDIPLSQKLNGHMPTQWAYPNGWAPLHWLVIEGLERYGYHAEARQLAMRWLRTNLRWFQEHGNFIEKYNVVDLSKPPSKGVYPTQTGFGWTNCNRQPVSKTKPNNSKARPAA